MLFIIFSFKITEMSYLKKKVLLISAQANQDAK